MPAGRSQRAFETQPEQRAGPPNCHTRRGKAPFDQLIERGLIIASWVFAFWARRRSDAEGRAYSGSGFPRVSGAKGRTKSPRMKIPHMVSPAYRKGEIVSA